MSLMKKIMALSLFFIFATSCIKTKIHGIRVESPASKMGYFKKVESCTPTLSWQPVEDAISYDVAVYQALGDPERDSGPPERGSQVFYKEGIADTHVMVTPQLGPKTRYLWSVRMKKRNGDVTKWSTYDKYMNLGYFMSDAKGFWFGIKTPSCHQEDSVASADQKEERGKNKVKIKYDTRSNYTDAEISSKLAAGEGAFVLGAFSFGVKNRKADLSQYNSWEEVIQSETEPRKPGYIPIYVIFPDGREVELLPNRKTSLYLLMAPPGEYILSRITYGDAPYVRSSRIFSKFNIEPGFFKYSGDILQIQFKSIIGTYVAAKPVFRFNPERLKKHITNIYPHVLQAWREEMLLPRELERGESEDKNRETAKPATVKPVKATIAKQQPPTETVPSQPKAAVPLPIPEPKAVPVVKKELEIPPTPAPEKARPTGCLRDEGSLKPLYALERCEVNALAKRCSPGDACMIDCYVSRKGETVEGGCYKICNVFAKGWAIPQEWAACR